MGEGSYLVSVTLHLYPASISPYISASISTSIPASISIPIATSLPPLLSLSLCLYKPCVYVTSHNLDLIIDLVAVSNVDLILTEDIGTVDVDESLFDDIDDLELEEELSWLSCDTSNIWSIYSLCSTPHVSFAIKFIDSTCHHQTCSLVERIVMSFWRFLKVAVEFWLSPFNIECYWITKT